MNKKIRIIMAKPGLDGHDRGIKILARAYRDAGMEVIYLGLRQTPEMIINAAIEFRPSVNLWFKIVFSRLEIFPCSTSMTFFLGIEVWNPVEKFSVLLKESAP